MTERRDPMSEEFAKLRWRCRRGMRELDAVLRAYLESSYETLDAADKLRFARLLDLPDPELYAYVVGRSVPDDPDTARIVRGIRYSLHSES